ncbi:MAG: GDP-mannose 4,6-dehydratase [Anaerolineae bacterium]|nr:GDP-mannose 4,6-dehydratase [Anaerolineae bacterium]MDW8173207.1 GDP-mannose 4,6-dehydratase [Anaerolineae bacterium]
MRILITGATGFVGRHLWDHLQQAQPNATLHGTTFMNPPQSSAYTEIDLKDSTAVLTLLDHLRPQAIYHLAGQAFVPRSFSDPWETLETNIRGQMNLLQACHTLKLDCRVLIVSSAEIYGRIQPTDLPLRESAPLQPLNPYSVSKAAQDLMALQYHLCYGMPILRARPFNHIGPGQSEHFVATAFAMQIALIEHGLQEPIIRVGNLSAQRDFTDVRDIVRAYHLLMERGADGEAYNIASGRAYSIQTLLDTLLSFSGVQVTVEQDKARLRPVDTPIIIGDYSKLHAATAWQPLMSFEDTLRDVLDDCRQRVRLNTYRS